ncbi:MAG: hypothetical protein JHD28_05340 [Bacteroidia bacterium]|nr:hypothetical protein [Bacteroidia bacterium]
MNTPEIIGWILTSSFVTTLMTSFVSWVLQKDNYRRDYYKKLLDKRIESYESVRQLTSLFAANIQLDDGRLCQARFALGKDHYLKFETKIYSVIQDGFWLSESVSQKLMELNAFLVHNIHNSIDSNGNIDKQLVELGILHRDTLKQFRYDLDQLLYTEFSSLHQIEKFTKARPMTDGIPIYGKSNP